MKKSRFTNSQIMPVLKQAEIRTAGPDQCRKHGISNATFYKWRARYRAPPHRFILAADRQEERCGFALYRKRRHADLTPISTQFHHQFIGRRDDAKFFTIA